MKQMDQRRTSTAQIFPFPLEGDTVWETPPCFDWISTGADSYTVTVRNSQGFFWQGVTKDNYLVPDQILEPGEYQWNVETTDSQRGWFRFTIAPEAVRFLRPSGDQIFDAVPESVRPRHLFTKAEIPEILESRKSELEVLKRNIAQAYLDGIPAPPSFYSQNKDSMYKTNGREYFGRHRTFMDRNLVACALGWQLLGDRKAGEFGLDLMMAVCSWDPEAECSLFGGFCDEIGLSNARCLPTVYDLLLDLMTPPQEALARKAIIAYALQCERRLIETNFVSNPGNSHVGRIPAYLGEAAMVLKGTDTPETMLRRWLTLSAKIYGGIFPFYGGQDGSWAEGPFYASSYTKWYLPFFNAVDRFLGKSYLDRPFYQRLSQYMLHFADPETEIHPFGDGYWCRSQDPEWPGFCAQDPFRVYAEKFGPEEARIKEKAIAQPDLYLLHLLDIFLPIRHSHTSHHLTGQACHAAAFPHAGFVSMRSNLASTENCLAVIARASKFGSGSHSHADQGSFCIFYNGKALISPSGYFGRGYGTTHHMKWTNTTQAHNCILADGLGQPAWNANAVGKILGCSQDGPRYQADLDLSEAYPNLTSWMRHLEMDTDRLEVTVDDTVTAAGPVTLDWLLHSLSRPEANGCKAHLTRSGIRLEITPEEGLTGQPEILDRFPVDVNADQKPENYVQVPPQFHMRWTTAPEAVHHIRVRFHIFPSPSIK